MPIDSTVTVLNFTHENLPETLACIVFMLITLLYWLSAIYLGPKSKKCKISSCSMPPENISPGVAYCIKNKKNKEDIALMASLINLGFKGHIRIFQQVNAWKLVIKNAPFRKKLPVEESVILFELEKAGGVLWFTNKVQKNSLELRRAYKKTLSNEYHKAMFKNTGNLLLAFTLLFIVGVMSTEILLIKNHRMIILLSCGIISITTIGKVIHTRISIKNSQTPFQPSVIAGLVMTIVCGLTMILSIYDGSLTILLTVLMIFYPIAFWLISKNVQRVTTEAQNDIAEIYSLDLYLRTPNYIRNQIRENTINSNDIILLPYSIALITYPVWLWNMLDLTFNINEKKTALNHFCPWWNFSHESRDIFISSKSAYNALFNQLNSYSSYSKIIASDNNDRTFSGDLAHGVATDFNGIGSNIGSSDCGGGGGGGGGDGGAC